MGTDTCMPKFKTQTIDDYEAMGIDPRAFVGWKPEIWYSDSTISEPENKLFFDWQEGDTILQCMKDFTSQVNQNPLTSFYANTKTLKKWKIVGCKDLNCDWGGFPNDEGF